MIHFITPSYLPIEPFRGSDSGPESFFLLLRLQFDKSRKKSEKVHKIEPRKRFSVKPAFRQPNLAAKFTVI